MAFSSILVPVDEMDLAVRFLSDVLNLKPKFQDGTRYAAFPSENVGFALLGDEERIVSEPCLGIKVENLDETLITWSKLGAEIIRPVDVGPHELRAVVRIPGGVMVMLSQKIS